MSNQSQEAKNPRDPKENPVGQEEGDEYHCQCGKIYSSYPALYFHARLKHEVRLKSIRTQFNSKVEKINGKTIISYFLQEIIVKKQQQQIEPIAIQQNNQSDWQRTKRILNQYSLAEQEQDSQLKNCKGIIVEQIINYMEGVVIESDSESPVGIEDIPLYYNDFLLHYIPTAYEQKQIPLNALGQTENELIKLWRWLRMKKYVSCHLLKLLGETPLLS